MDQTPRAIDPEELLAQMGWVQALARSLVRDPNQARDVAQEAWLLALERPPRTAHSGPSLRAWLSKVTRTLARQSVRSSTRRHIREQRAARSEAVASTLDIVERGDVQKRLVATVMELGEPYRSTVLFRYLDGLSAPEIAVREACTPAAVRKRLSRGLAMLRERLDDSHGGDGHSWALGVAALAFGSEQAAAATLAGGAGMGAPGGAVRGWQRVLLPGGALILVVGLVTLAMLSLLDAGAGPAVTTTVGPRTADRARGDLDAGPGVAEGIEALSGTVAGGAPKPDADVGAMTFSFPSLTAPVRGRLFDGRGDPLPDVRLRFEPDARGKGGDALRNHSTITALSDAEGRYVLEDVERSGRVLVASSRYVTVMSGNVRPWRRHLDQIVLAAERRPFTGSVVDESGAPVVGAAVALQLPEGFASRLTVALDAVTPYRQHVVTDDRGRFALPDAPDIDDLRLQVVADGFEIHRDAAPGVAGADLVLTLVRPAHVIRGSVLDPVGVPVPAAHVSCGLATAMTVADGSFELHLRESQLAPFPRPGNSLGWGPLSERSLRLVAVKAGMQPSQLDLPLPEDLTAGLVRTGVVLTLGAETATISGRVVAPDGTPMLGVEVWIEDPGVLAVHERRLYDNEQDTRTGGGAGHARGPQTLVESVARGAPDEYWATVSSGEDGRFELTGLLDREYHVAAYDRYTLVRAEQTGVAAGRDDVELVLDMDAVLPRVAGRVVAPDGTPLAGIGVSATMDVFQVGGSRSLVSASGVVTDSEGRFALTRVAREGSYLSVGGDGVLDLEFGRPPGTRLGERQDVASLEIVLRRRVDLGVALALADEADRFEIRDGAGAVLPLSLLTFDVRRQLPSARVLDGRSEIVSVSEDADTLILYSGEDEVRRVRLDLQPGALHLIH